MKKITLLSIMLLIVFSGYSQLSPNRSSYKYTLKRKDLIGKVASGKNIGFETTLKSPKTKQYYNKKTTALKGAYDNSQFSEKALKSTEGVIKRKNFMLIKKVGSGGDYESNTYTKNHYFGWDKLKANVTLDKGRLLVDILRPLDEGNFNTTHTASNTTDFPTSKQIKTSDMLYEIDLLRENIGQPMRVIRLPFTATTWSAGIIAARYRIPKKGTGYPPSFGSATSVGLVGTIQQTWGYSYFNSKTVTHYTVSLGGVVGFSSAEISSSTIKSDPEFKSYKTDVGGNKIFLPSTIFGAHLLLGRNNLGLSISAGYEYAIGPYSKGWIYQGRPWVGIGIITSLGMF